MLLSRYKGAVSVAKERGDITASFAVGNRKLSDRCEKAEEELEVALTLNKRQSYTIQELLAENAALKEKLGEGIEA